MKIIFKIQHYKIKVQIYMHFKVLFLKNKIQFYEIKVQFFKNKLQFYEKQNEYAESCTSKYVNVTYEGLVLLWKTELHNGRTIKQKWTCFKDSVKKNFFFFFYFLSIFER